MAEGLLQCVELTLTAAVSRLEASGKSMTLKVTVTQPAGSVTVVASARAPHPHARQTGGQSVAHVGAGKLPAARGSLRRSSSSKPMATAASSPAAAPPVVVVPGGGSAAAARRSKKLQQLEHKWRARRLLALARIFYGKRLRAWVRARVAALRGRKAWDEHMAMAVAAKTAALEGSNPMLVDSGQLFTLGGQRKPSVFDFTEPTQGKRPSSLVEGLEAGRPPPPAEQAAWQHTLAESGFPVWQVADILEILRSIDDDTERAEFLAQVLVEGPWQDAERPARGSTSTEEHFPRADGLA
jgi:hypothetical protein